MGISYSWYMTSGGRNSVLSKHSVDRYTKVGQDAQKAGDKSKAIESYEKVLSIDSNNTDVRKELSLLYYQNKQYDKSADSWKQVVDKTPDDSVALNSLANAYRDQGNNEAAIDNYKKAIEAGNLDSVGNLVTLYNINNRFSDSIALLSPLIEKYPDDKSLKQLLASTYSKMGDSKKASEILAQLK